MDKVALGAGFLRVLRFPLPIFIPPTAPQSPSSIIWVWHNRPVPAVPSGLSLTSLKNKKKNSRTKYYIAQSDFYIRIICDTIFWWVGYVAGIGKRENGYGFEGKRSYARPWRTMEGNIKTDLKGKICEAVD
jgi:hypothetical protein